MNTNEPNQNNSTVNQGHDLHEDHGLPSVNRRAGSNKLVTVIGTIFLLLVGVALIVAVNSGDKNKKDKKNQVADKVGSIKVGKDADLVLWSNHPLSIYAVAEKTMVDGIVYFDRTRDLELRKKISSERNRLVQKMLGEKRSGAPTRPAEPSWQVILSCGDHDHHDGLITVDLSTDDTINN